MACPISTPQLMGENTDGSSKHKGAGGGALVLTVPPLKMASKGGTLAKTLPLTLVKLHK